MSKKSIRQYMRNLHRDIGFLMIGLTLIYCFSGIVLIYRDTDLLKFEKTIEKTVEANLNEETLKGALHFRYLEVTSNQGDTIIFNNGSYCKSTGELIYTVKSHPEFISKLNSLHKRPSKNLIHWFSVVYATLLFFLAISSFWMFKAGTKKFYRGVALTAAGLIFALILLFL